MPGLILQPFRQDPSVTNTQEHDQTDPSSIPSSPKGNSHTFPDGRLGDSLPSPDAAPFITVGNTPYYLAPPTTSFSSAVNIISPNPLKNDPPILSIDDGTYTANKASQYIISNQVLSAGGSTINVNGIRYSIAPSVTPSPEIASISSFLLQHKAPLLTIDGQTYTADSASRYIIGSQTLIPGGPTVTINKVPYALPSSVTAIISNAHTKALDPNPTADASVISMLNTIGLEAGDPIQTYTVDGVLLTGNPTFLETGSKTLRPGSPPLITSGHTSSLATGSALVVDGSTSILESQPSPQTYNIDGIHLTGGPDALTADGTTLIPGSPPLTLLDHTLSLGIDNALIIDGYTSALAPQAIPQTYMVDGIQLTGNPNALKAGSATLTPGSPAITVSGHTMSLAIGGALIVDGSTSSLSYKGSLGPASVASLVAQPMGVSVYSNGSNSVMYTGVANRWKSLRHAWQARVIAAVLFVLSSI